MKRKQFKRNVQAQRQRRSVTYMNDRVYKRRQLLQHAAGGLFIGVFLTFIIFKAFGIY